MLSVLRQIRRTRFGNKPIFTDCAHWYNDACKWLRLKHVIYGTELKNIWKGSFSRSIHRPIKRIMKILKGRY
jgi:hypothetical protein